MKDEQFYIHWVRNQPLRSPAEIGERFLQSLDVLSRLNSKFGPWYVYDNGYTILRPLEDVRHAISEFVERGVSRDEDGIPEPAYGYTVSAINYDVEKRDADPYSVNLTVRVGGGTFETSYGIVPASSVVAYPIWKAVLVNICPIWEAASGKAYSSDLRRRWDLPPFRFDLSWMTYLGLPLAAQIAPPKDVLVERMQDGCVLIAAEEMFDVSNPKHMAAAHAIREALGPINDLAEHAQAKQRSDDLERQIKALGMPIKRVRSGGAEM